MKCVATLQIRICLGHLKDRGFCHYFTMEMVQQTNCSIGFKWKKFPLEVLYKII